MRKIGPTCALLLVASNACAVDLAQDGTGDAVLIPFYEATEARTTLFSVNNTSGEPKAVRVVIAEGRNGRAALAFNLYLKPHDSWSGGIMRPEATLAPLLISSDDSCTGPAIPPSGEPLRNAGFSGSRDDGLGDTRDRLAVGQIEIIEMGVPTGEAAQLIASHSCSALTSRMVTGGIWKQQPNSDMAQPSGGLAGEARILDVGAGVAWDVRDIALSGFSAAPRHGVPADSTNEVRIVRPTSAGGQFTIGSTDGATTDRGADAISFLLMSSHVDAEFVLAESLGAETRLAVSFPTRSAYLDDRPGGELPGGSGPVAPFDHAVTTNAVSCIETDWQSISPAGEMSAPVAKSLCEQVNVVGFTGEDSYIAGLSSGFLHVGFRPGTNSLAVDSTSGPFQSHGLPVVVQSLIEVQNANAQPGLLASYAMSGDVTRHRTDDTE